MSSRHPVHTYTGYWIIFEKVRKTWHQANHLGTPQNNLGTPLGVPTPTLGTTDLDDIIQLGSNSEKLSVADARVFCFLGFSLKWNDCGRGRQAVWHRQPASKLAGAEIESSSSSLLHIWFLRVPLREINVLLPPLLSSPGSLFLHSACVAQKKKKETKRKNSVRQNRIHFFLLKGDLYL